MASSLLPAPFISLRTRKSFNLPWRIHPLRLSCCSGGSSQNRQVSSDSEEKRSFAVATGEFFIGVASRLLKSSNQRTSPLPIDGGERIAAKIKDEIEPAMIWEQRIKDVEAEKERRIVTIPGFSFSWSFVSLSSWSCSVVDRKGLHHGASFSHEFLVFITNYDYGKNMFFCVLIQETTPLVGSSACAIVCAMISQDPL